MRATAYVHLYPPHHNAGGETTLHDIFKVMLDNGWDVEVILSRAMPGYDEPYYLDGVLVSPYKNKHQIVHAVPKSDLLVTHLENSERTALLGKRWKVPVAQVIHNDMRMTHTYIATGCDLAIFNTEWVSHQYDWFTGPRVTVHPLIDVPKYKTSSRSKKFITLVNMYKPKGTDVFYEMAKRFPNEQFLAVIGGYGEQDLRSGYPNVTFQPHTPEIVRDVYSKTKLILMPSDYESFGRVAIEAAASGIPTIAAPTKGLLEALGNGDGVFVDNKDYDGWELAIKTVLGDLSVYRSRAKRRAEYWTTIQSLEKPHLMNSINSVAMVGRRVRGI